MIFVKMQLFDAYIMPISGVDFVRYIGFISYLSEYCKNRGRETFKPTVIYCASGGCLTAYMALMSDFSSNVENWEISSKMFIRRPTPYTPRLLTLTLKGFLYHRMDTSKFLKEVFVPSKLLDVEIITGFYENGKTDQDEHKICIVTNKPREYSSIQDFNPPTPTIHVTYADPYPDDFFDLNPDKALQSRKSYLDKLMETSLGAMHNTSNIPFVASPRGENKAIDFGIVSPTTRIITNAIINKGIYMSPINIDKKDCLNAFSAIFHNILLNDYIVLKNTFEQERDFPNMDLVLSFLPGCARYCLVLYTASEVDIDIESFTCQDAKRFIIRSKNTVRIRLLFDPSP
jgi:hypothetical protein